MPLTCNVDGGNTQYNTATEWCDKLQHSLYNQQSIESVNKIYCAESLAEYNGRTLRGQTVSSCWAAQAVVWTSVTDSFSDYNGNILLLWHRSLSVYNLFKIWITVFQAAKRNCCLFHPSQSVSTREPFFSPHESEVFFVTHFWLTQQYSAVNNRW